MPRLIRVFIGHTSNFAGFVMLQLKYYSSGQVGRWCCVILSAGPFYKIWLVYLVRMTCCPSSQMTGCLYLSLVTWTCLWGFRPGETQTELARVLNFWIYNVASIGIILSIERTTKALIRLCWCAGWSAPLLFIYGITRCPWSQMTGCLY